MVSLNNGMLPRRAPSTRAKNRAVPYRTAPPQALIVNPPHFGLRNSFSPIVTAGPDSFTRPTPLASQYVLVVPPGERDSIFSASKRPAGIPMSSFATMAPNRVSLDPLGSRSRALPFHA